MYSRQREDYIEAAERTSDLSRVYDFGVLDYDFGMLSASDYCFGEGTVGYAMVRLLILSVCHSFKFATYVFLGWPSMKAIL